MVGGKGAQSGLNQINLNDVIKKNKEYDQKHLFKKNFIPKIKATMHNAF